MSASKALNTNRWQSASVWTANDLASVIVCPDGSCCTGPLAISVA